MKDGKNLALVDLSFTELKTIKDACLITGKSGSARALKIGQAVEKMMGEVTL